MKKLHSPKGSSPFQIIQIIQIQFLGVPWGVRIHFLYAFHGGYPMGCAILEGSWCRRWLQMARLRMKWSKWSITMVRCQWSMGYNGHIHEISMASIIQMVQIRSFLHVYICLLLLETVFSHGFSNIFEAYPSYPHDYDPTPRVFWKKTSWHQERPSLILQGSDLEPLKQRLRGASLMWVCLKMLCTPLYPMVLLIIIPFFKMASYHWEYIPNIFRQTHVFFRS